MHSAGAGRPADGQWLRDIYRATGPKVALLLAVAVPAGVCLGIVEIVTASVLYSVLVEFHLASGAAASSQRIAGLDPIAALLLFSTIAAVLRFAGQLLPALANHAMIKRLREALIRSVLGGVTERSVMSVSETSHLLSNVIQRSGDFINSIVVLSVSLFLMLLVLSGLLYMSWQITITALAFVVLLGSALGVLRRVYGRYIEGMHAYSRRLSITFLRDVRNNHLLRILGANEREIGHLIRLSNDYFGNFKRYYFWFGLGGSLPALAGVFLIVGLFWLNARIGLLSAAALLPLVYLLTRVAGSLGTLATAAGQLHQTRPYFAELVGYLPQIFPGPDRPVGNEVPTTLFPLAVRNLRFGRDAALVTPVSFSAAAGEMLVISGESGIGKTTLIMTLVGLLRPLGGEISWGGMPIERIDPARLRQRIGYAGPEPYLIDADIRSNLLLGTRRSQVSDVEIQQALRLARAEFVMELPEGLSHRLQEAGEGVSAGQKQRLALARCILCRPEVLLLDEATANIDEETERQIVDGIRAAFPSLLIIAVSHRTSLRRHATTIIEL